MKNFRLLRRTFRILLGAVGVSALFASCARERECKCKYTYGGQTTTFIITAKEPCYELDREVEYDNEVIYTLTCEKD